MIQETHGWITIHDVAKANGWQLTNDQAWKIGSFLATQWELHVGAPPIKDLRTKKNGTGSHCFALYPPQWRGRIEDLIHLHGRPAPQLVLDLPPPT